MMEPPASSPRAPQPVPTPGAADDSGEEGEIGLSSDQADAILLQSLEHAAHAHLAAHPFPTRQRLRDNFLAQWLVVCLSIIAFVCYIVLDEVGARARARACCAAERPRSHTFSPSRCCSWSTSW
jgi:hypothetical protein